MVYGTCRRLVEQAPGGREAAKVVPLAYFRDLAPAPRPGGTHALRPDFIKVPPPAGWRGLAWAWPGLIRSGRLVWSEAGAEATLSPVSPSNQQPNNHHRHPITTTTHKLLHHYHHHQHHHHAFPATTSGRSPFVSSKRLSLFFTRPRRQAAFLLDGTSGLPSGRDEVLAELEAEKKLDARVLDELRAEAR